MAQKNKVAIVTGGTRGIGEAIVKTFVKDGYRVAFTYLSSDKLASKIEKETKKRAIGFNVDVSDLVAMKLFVKDVQKKFNRLDVLVNNAGIIKDKPLLIMEKGEWDSVIDTNLSGVFNTTRACAFTFMKQKSGNIVNVSSLSAVYGIAGQTNYAASKAGVIGLTKSFAREAGPYNVRINSVVPGFIETDMTKKIGKQVREDLLKLTPLKRFGLPREVAELVLFLASDKSGFITGQTFVIDGGFLT